MAKAYSRPIPRAPKCDPQRTRLYRMEHEAIGARGEVLWKRWQTQRLARSVCRAFKISRVKIKFIKSNEWAGLYYRPDTILINPKSGINALTPLHELAHHLHDQLAPDNTHADHGPQFMACYMSILDATRMIPVCAMRAICKYYKLDYIDPGENTSLTTLKARIRRGKVVHGQKGPRAK